MQDAGIVEIASSPEAYIRYLELQGENPYYSPGNIALAMFQKSDVTQFGTREKWRSRKGLSDLLPRHIRQGLCAGPGL